MTDSPTNAPELSVSDLAGALKRTIEDAFGRVRLRGEISGYKGPVGSGHVYFSLKDTGARIDAVIWRGVFAKLRFRPEEGMEVIATGKVTTFPGGSRYQIVIDQLEPAGVGALMALLEERRKKMHAEGLFDPARKQLLPYLPDVIGVVTSPTGAVIRDILHRLSDRFPRHVIIWPVRVQGETSAGEVAAAIRGFNALPLDGVIPRPDVLIVARGGGSLEDLWGFNEEIVVRAAADSEIPLISAVGHETDTTLIDFAADVRAPTPTAAAEMVVPVRADLLSHVRTLAARMLGGVSRSMERNRADVRSAARALPTADTLLAGRRQQTDLINLRFSNALRRGLEGRRQAMQAAARRLDAQTPRARLARFSERISGFGSRLKGALQTRVMRSSDRLGVASGRLAPLMRSEIEWANKALTGMSDRFTRAFATHLAARQADQSRQSDRFLRTKSQFDQAFTASFAARRRHLEGQSALLNSLGYRQVLSRGFALVRGADGRPVRSAAATAPGMAVSIEFSDESVSATIAEGAAAGIAPAKAAPKAKPPRQSGGGGQGDLF